VESAFDVLHRKPENYRPAVRASRGRTREQKFIDEPLHLLVRELHVDLDGSFDLAEDVVPDGFFVKDGYMYLV